MTETQEHVAHERCEPFWFWDSADLRAVPMPLSVQFSTLVRLVWMQKHNLYCTNGIGCNQQDTKLHFNLPTSRDGVTGMPFPQ